MLVASLLLSTLATAICQDPQAGSPRIEWQRSLEDALAVQKATGKPLLIVVNMDGEVFNDRFATTTYRDRAFVETTRGYVCVVASPDRHTPRDHDALGNRIECPRFPGCTCSEHIAIEPELFKRWFDGKQYAPRHLAVSKDGKVLFDRFLDNSMQTAIDAVRQFAGKPGTPEVPADLKAMFSRRDAAARRAVEDRYRTADAAGRILILEAAGTATNDPAEVLHMGLRDPDDRVFGAAARALAKLADENALPLVEQALARAEDEAVQKALLARLAEIGKRVPAAARLASHFERSGERQLSQPWRNEWSEPAFDVSRRATLDAALDKLEPAVRAAPADAEARLALATAQAAMAEVIAAEGGSGVEFWLEDARRSAAKVEADTLKADAAAVRAVTAWRSGDPEAAQKAATLALATAHTTRRPDPWLAEALLEVVVQTTAQAAYGIAQQSADKSLRPQIERVETVMELLHARGAGTESTTTAAVGLLEYSGLRRAARRELAAAVRRFPGSPALHERWRNRLLADLGAEAMRAQYDEFVSAVGDKATAQWFAGYAALIAAEQHMRDERPDVAAAAYTESIDRFDACAAANEDFADSAHHFTVLALGGRAHLLLAAGDGQGAVRDLERAAALRPDSLDETDGLLRKPRAIAGRVARKLTENGQAELAARLQAIVQ
jgi:hypothetical protein